MLLMTEKEEARAAAAPAVPLVLIVDDDERVRRSLARAVRAAGYETLAFDRIASCLQYCRENRPACLVLDLHLPGESGLDLARTLEAEHRSVPVVFISADDEALRQTRTLAHTVASLHKPFERGDFLAAVGKAVARRRRPTLECDHKLSDAPTTE